MRRHLARSAIKAVSFLDEWPGSSRTSRGTTCVRNDSRHRTSSLTSRLPLESVFVLHTQLQRDFNSSENRDLDARL